MNCDRLHDLWDENERKRAGMDREAGRFAALASRHADGTAPRAVSAFNLFQTPEEIAQQMVDLLGPQLRPGTRILEPSAGLGRLFRPLWDTVGNAGRYMLVEESGECMAELYRLTEHCSNVKLRQADFLSQSIEDLGGVFDIVCMNPPFKMWRDIKHIRHAQSMLKDDGILVALCANGPKQQAAFKYEAEHWEELSANSFRSEGTSVNVALMILRKVAE